MQLTAQVGTLESVLERYSQLPMLKGLAEQIVLVPPEGRPGSPLMLVGEAPGKDEALQGRPFVGRAGSQLDYVLKRTNVNRELFCWVTNVVLFRPPGNRTPYPFEIQVSRERLGDEILICQPISAVALGATAWTAVRPWSNLPGAAFMEARGQELMLDVPWGIGDTCQSVRLLVTHHPAACFHNDAAEDEMIDQIKRFLG